MVILTRAVRFSLSPDAPPNRGPNGYAGNPSMSGLGAFYELVVSCRGEIDPTLGYLINIKEIDQVVRAHAVPRIHGAMSDRGTASMAEDWLVLSLLVDLFKTLPVRSLRSLRWRLTPYYSIEVTAREPTTVLLRQKFDFCAAHRLHSAELSPEENRRYFGKCNNLSGHGHNYQVEPCIAIPTGTTRPVLSLRDVEQLADELVIQRFDHKNLNTDTEEFRDGSGLNPSVENIARVCYTLLAPAIEKTGASLQSVTVWESDRTSCTYPG